MSDAFNRQIARGLKRSGRSVTLVNQDAQTDGSGNPKRDADYNDILWQSESTTDTDADLVYRGTPQFERRADGIEEDVDIIGFVDQGDPVKSGEDDETVRSTRVELNGKRYVVRDVFDEGNGLTRFHGSLED